MVRAEERAATLAFARTLWHCKSIKSTKKSNVMQEKRKMGRPPVDTEAITLRLPREIIQALDDRRREESDLPTRPEIIRRLLADVLHMHDED